jgi:acylphosphatase
MIVAIRLSIAGRVQGVGFRAFVTHQAQRQSLRGWVRNRHDGSVEALLIGEADVVGAVIDVCRRGPPSARVDHVEQLPAQDDGTPDFTERSTV